MLGIEIESIMLGPNLGLGVMRLTYLDDNKHKFVAIASSMACQPIDSLRLIRRSPRGLRVRRVFAFLSLRNNVYHFSPF